MAMLPEEVPQEGSGNGLAAVIDDLSNKIVLVELLEKACDDEVNAFIVFFEEILMLRDRMIAGQSGLGEEIRGMIRMLSFDLANTLKRQRS